MEKTIDRRHALGSLAAAGAAFLAVPHLAKAVSFAAPTLAEEFGAARAREKAAWAVADEWDGDNPNSELSRTLKASRAVIDKIIAAPARNIDDCKLKARAYLWCYDGDAEDALGVLEDQAKTTDVRIIHALMRDLLALGEA